MSLTTAYGGEQLARVRRDLEYLPLADDGFPLLRYVDPWGKTMFNRTQIEAVVSELQCLAERLEDELPPEVAEYEKATIAGVLELANIVRIEPHLMLTLVGQ